MLASSAGAVASDDVQTFLRDYVKDHHVPIDGATRYSVAPVFLDDKTQMDLVYLSGRWWCGSGGCTALLLEPDQSSFKVIQRFTLVGLPIRVLPNRTNGWHDLALWVRGGGMSGHVATLQYDGLSYPSNPSLAATQLIEMPDGVDLPLTQEGKAMTP